MLQRGIQKFPEDMRLKVEIEGIYAVPEEWSGKLVSIVTDIVSYSNLYL